MPRFLHSVLSHAAFVLRALVLGLLDRTPGRWRCHSLVAGQRVTLQQRFLASADTVEIEMITPWAPGWAWLQPVLRVQVLDDQRRPLPGSARTSQDCEKGNLRFKAELPAAAGALGPQFTAQLINAESAGVLAEIIFTRLDRQQVLDAIQVRSFQVLVPVAGRTVSTNQLHDQVQSAFVHTEIELPDQELRPVLDQAPPQLRLLFLAPSGQVLEAKETTLRFEGTATTWEHDLSATLPRLRGHAGAYELRLLVQERALHSVRLDVRSWDEVLAETTRLVESESRVTLSRAIAVNHRSQAEPLDVVTEDYQSLAAEVALEVPSGHPLMPETALPLKLEARDQQGHVLASVTETRCVLRPGPNQLSMRLRVRPEIFTNATRQGVLGVFLGSRLLASFPFTRRTRAEIRAATEARIRASLVINDFQVAVQREGEVVVTEPAFATDEGLVPQFTITGNGFDEDVPELVSPVDFHLLNPQTGFSLRTAIRLRLHPGLNRCVRVRLPLTNQGAPIPGGHYRLGVFVQERELAHAKIRLLASEELIAFAQHRVLDSLRATEVGLRYECGGEVVRGSRIPFCANRLLWSMKLEAEGFNGLLQDWNLPIEVQVSGVARRAVPVAQGQVTLSAVGAMVELPVLVGGTPLESHSGELELHLFVLGRQIATKKVQILSAADLAQTLEVPEIQINATDAEDRTNRNVSTICASHHRQLQIRVTIRPTVVVPGSAIPVRIELNAARATILSAEHHLALGPSVASWSLSPVSVQAIWIRLQRSPQTLTLRVVIAGIVRASREIQVEAEAKLTAFDGSLRQAPDALGDVEQEYDTILAEIGR